MKDGFEKVKSGDWTGYVPVKPPPEPKPSSRWPCNDWSLGTWLSAAFAAFILIASGFAANALLAYGIAWLVLQFLKK